MAGGKQIGNLTSLVYGMLNFSGKGSISAGNVLTVNAVVIANETALGLQLSNMAIYLDGAFNSPNSFDVNGVARYISLGLNHIVGRLWKGGPYTIEYNQGGLLPIELDLNNSSYGIVGVVQLGPQDVTIGTRTNSLVISLTWAILAFAVLEIRLDTYRHKTDPKNNKN